MCRVWNAPATRRLRSRAFAGGLSASAARDHLARTVHVGRGQAVVREHGLDLVRVPAEHGRHAGLRDRRCLGHRLTALTREHERGLGGDDAGDGGGGELAHAVPGHDVGRDTEHLVRDEGRTDEQRLRDGGVADLVGVGGRPVTDQVEPGDGGPPREAVLHTGEFEPCLEESGCLGALPGRGDGEHAFNSAL
jgi:hypothetical protein